VKIEEVELGLEKKGEKLEGVRETVFYVKQLWERKVKTKGEKSN